MSGDAQSPYPLARCTPCPVGRRPGQGGMVQALSRERAAGALRPYRAELGYRQQGNRAQRLLGVHNVVARISSASYTLCAISFENQLVLDHRTVEVSPKRGPG